MAKYLVALGQHPEDGLTIVNVKNFYFTLYAICMSGAKLGNSKRGGGYICKRKDEIIHGLGPSIK